MYNLTTVIESFFFFRVRFGLNILVEISTRNLSWGELQQAHKADPNAIIKLIV
jgi:hypothetical protein